MNPLFFIVAWKFFLETLSGNIWKVKSTGDENGLENRRA